MTELEKIIKGCKQKDIKYQKMLFNLYAGKMKYVCLRYLSSNEDAEDAVQEGFIKVFSSIDTYEARGVFDGWIRKIFVNIALMALREKKKKNENSPMSTIHEDLYADEDHQMEEEIDHTEINPDKIDFNVILKADFSQEELLSCVSSLDEIFRVIFNLYFIDKFKHAEIASMLQIDENTSRTRLLRARKKIQAELYKRSIKKVSQ
ncbi:MAG: sigma-70 family RNA polymerase sigma factor [Sporocytophaga sp.]|uniref:RNA polymerase sigma factor n=1 Tax=Sporocytophaga sp. TaxID=2231183 RepID=UPI001B1F894C|nr:sigma-70 family RNA polymerase sigma factor [Sporocytophaga sp.]MBO9702433.1 sigma-70 family RNA polymerase sigma factor [Sporocytophaga sp.]